MNRDNKGSFWPSYVDVMTTLFAITLVLFVVSFARFQIKEKELERSNRELDSINAVLKIKADTWDDIETVYKTVGKIDSSGYFAYNEQYLKHLFTIDVGYQDKKFRMHELLLDNYDRLAADRVRRDVLDAGKLVKATIQSIETGTSTNNIKFLVVIEGQASRIPFGGADEWHNNNTVSYLRAYHLNEFWKQNGIDIDGIPHCELIISGSGEQGVPRNIPNERLLHVEYPNHTEYQRIWNDIERSNQRFLIHIVPVIGNIDVSENKI